MIAAMPISEYVRCLRAKVGTDLLLVPSATGLVFDEAGRVLLARHTTGDVWAPPGGAIDPDERPVDAAVREVWEETGLLVEPVGLAGVFGGPEFRVHYAGGDVTAYVITIYECRVVGGRLRADGDGISELRWVAPSELAGLHLAPWARSALPELIASRGRAVVPAPTWTPPAA
jgi:8-oxo-dGTP pyrophosphatase MutT (NUDIX family)